MSHVCVKAATNTVPHCFVVARHWEAVRLPQAPHRTALNKHMQTLAAPQSAICVRWCKARALSVSISAKLSPAATSSPTFFFHDAMFPDPQSFIITRVPWHLDLHSRTQAESAWLRDEALITRIRQHRGHAVVFGVNFRWAAGRSLIALTHDTMPVLQSNRRHEAPMRAGGAPCDMVGDSAGRPITLCGG